MKKLNLSALLAIIICIQANAQQDYRIMLHSGATLPPANLEQFITNGQPAADEIVEGYYYRFIQFNSVPTDAEKNNISLSGIVLLDYIPHNTFMAAISINYDFNNLRNFNIRSITAQHPIQKINTVLLGIAPDYAVKEKGLVDIVVQYQQNILPLKAKEAAQKAGVILKSSDFNHTITLRVPEKSIQDISQLPWVFYIDAVSPASTPDDTKGRSLHRANVINSDYVMGRHYDGSGVAAALADDGVVGPHIDFTGRLTNHLSILGGFHGDMTSGILAGAGNLDPVIRGMATGVQLHVFDIGPYPQIIDAVLNNATLGTTVSSTSYSQGCNQYTTDTQFGDQTLHDNPQLEFVFSAGNNGAGDCAYGAGAGWGNITGGYKQGKNVIACANLDALEILDPSSSRGPAADGRIKPDISANGKDQMSTAEGNTYQVGGGTSAACPGIAGIFTELTQAYKEINSATDAPTALIKACLLNGAEDIGNPGPDYTYGWGRVNALRAVETIEDVRYINGTISQGVTNLHTITVPANVIQMRVMVYWHDQGGTPLASVSLVNDLDMIVTDPSAVAWQPWVLDPTPNAVTLNNPAIRAADHLNNMEQVTIDNPAAGNYSVSIYGFAVPQGPQDYYLVYEFRTDDITVTYPIGGEGFVPGEQEVLRWDALKGLGTFTIDYSTDDGVSWTNIATNVAGTDLQYTWTVPNTVTGQARVRVSRGSVSGMSVEKFSIIGDPQNLAVDWACVDSIRLVWDAVPGAAWYEVSELGTFYMDSIGTSTTNSIVLTGTNPSNEYWFSCRAVLANGVRGRRAYAINKQPGTFLCPLSLDVKLVQFLNPPAGNLYGCQNLSAVTVTVQLQNKGQSTISNIPVHYTFNGGAPVNDIYTGTLAPNAIASFSFPGTVDMSLPATYNFKGWTDYAGDMNTYNDSVQIASTSFATATVPLIEPFQTAAFPPAGWSIDSAGAAPTWQKSFGITGSNGAVTDAAYIDNFTYDDVGAEDGLTTFTFDLTSSNIPRMTFDVAYARYDATYSDAMRIDVSTDCGIIFTPSGYYKAGLALATVGDNTNPFVPAAATDWRNDTLDLSAYTGNIVMVRFVNINGFGNNLYIDNVNVSDVTGIGENSFTNTISISPNPSNGLFNLHLYTSKAEKLNIVVTDIDGRIISNSETEVWGNYSSKIDLRNYAKGIYSVVVKGDGGVYRTRVVVL